MCWRRDLHPRSPFGRVVYSHVQLLLCHPSWSRQRDLNPRPSLYKSVALPLSYVGVNRFYQKNTVRTSVIKNKFSSLVPSKRLVFPRTVKLGRLCFCPQAKASSLVSLTIMVSGYLKSSEFVEENLPTFSNTKEQ